VEEISRLRREVTGEVFDYQVLTTALSDYSKPRDKITRLLASGAIVRIVRRQRVCTRTGLNLGCTFPIHV